MTDLPKNWSLVKLGEVARWSSGGTPQAGNPSYYNGEIPWAVIGDLNESTVFVTEKHLSQKGLDASSAKVVPAGTVLLAMYGASIGRVGMAGKPMATNQAIATAVVNPALLEPRFLLLYLQSQKSNFVKAAKGGAQPNISQTIIKNWDVPLPPIDEQRRIVETLDDHLSRLDKALAELEHADYQTLVLRRSILNDLLNPESFDSESGIEHMSISKLTPVPLHRVADVIDPHPSHRAPARVNQGIPFVGIGDLSKKTESSFPNARVVSRSIFDEHAARYDLQEGLLGLGRVASVGLVVDLPIPAVDSPYVVSPTLAVIKAKSIDKSYLKYQLMAPQVQLQLDSLKQGSGRQSVGVQKLRNVLIHVPPVEEQRRIVETLDDHLSRLDLTQESIASQKAWLATLRRSILNKAFNGELGTN